MRIGWLSSPGDPRISAALATSIEATTRDLVPVEVPVLLVAGAPDADDGLLCAARRTGMAVVSVDPAEHRRLAGGAWRDSFEAAVLGQLAPFGLDAGILVGYRWIAGPTLRDALPMVNIHPAPPDGPRGLEAEVIAALFASRATETGLTAHVVTADVDRGPVVRSVRVPLPPRAGVWPRHAIVRADIIRAHAECLAPFVAATLRDLAGDPGILSRWTRTR